MENNMQSKSNAWLPITLLVLLVAFSGWQYAQRNSKIFPEEQPVRALELAGPIADASAELSGLAWHGDTLILLPQYPERFGDGDGALFAISKSDILAALDAAHPTPLEPAPVPLTAPGLKESIPNFQGYEAIGFHGDRVYVTVEAGEGADMHGYLVGGVITANKVTLDTSNVVEIPLPFPSENHTDEALIVTDDSVLTFFELNGADLNPAPAAQAFDLNLNPKGTLSFPNLEYRLTDAALSTDGILWVINYFFPGDTDMLPQSDPLAEQFGEGRTHSKQDQVERLVQLSLGKNAITLTGSAPVQLILTEEEARNWEGLVLLDERGFLLATDKFPSTILAFVAMP
jgi:hypothetical protein